MTLRLKSVFLILIGFAIFWLFYLEREILSPFIFAAVFAYILNPVVNFLHGKLKIPRTLSVIVIYIFIIGVIVTSIFVSYKRFSDESTELRNQVKIITKNTKIQINTLPEWIRPTISDGLTAVENTVNVSYPSVYDNSKIKMGRT